MDLRLFYFHVTIYNSCRYYKYSLCQALIKEENFGGNCSLNLFGCIKEKGNEVFGRGPFSQISVNELTYRDLENTIQFSFLAIQFFPPTQKITIPKYHSFFFHKPRIKAKLFLAVTVKNDFNTVMSFFMKAVLLLLNVHVNCLDTRFFSQI